MKTLTDTEYREWERTACRPYTDRPFGMASATKRSQDAKLSNLVRGYERPKRRLITSPWTGRRYLV